jgi:HlyD family secretion protein
MSASPRSTSRRWLIVLAFLAFVAVVAIRARWKPGDAATDAAGAEEASPTGDRSEAGPGAGSDGDLAVPVVVDTVRRGTLEIRVSATGQTEAFRQAAVAARAPGRISDLLVGENDHVAAGQVVARLDDREALLAVRQAEAGREEAEARYREMTLFDDRIEDPVVRRHRAEAARARSGLETAEVEVRRARLFLDDTALTAPFAGRIANLRVERGNVLAAGQELLTVVDLAPVLVEVRVVESELRWLHEGGGAEITLPALPDTAFRGRIRSINPVVDPGTRAARVIVVLANPDGRILPGMFARVSLEGRSYENRVLVPGEAIVERDGGAMVFVFDPIPGEPGGGRARWVYVTRGLSNDRYVELVDEEGTKPPEPGTLVVTAGNYTLVHDARVRIAGVP